MAAARLTAGHARPGDIQLGPGDFQYFRTEIEQRAGIHVAPSKRELVQSRIRRRLLELSCPDFSAYASYLRSLSHDDPEWQIFINALTTNKTAFFREAAHFDQLTALVRARLSAGDRSQIRIWCAAASTGEEPYTIAMVMQDLCAQYGADFRIDASDIDTAVLQTAENGVYRREHLQDIPAKYHEKSILIGTEGIEDWLCIKRDLKKKIRFFPFNLTKGQLPILEGSAAKDTYDFIFCRNVLIYFRSETITEVAQLLHTAAAPGATLFIGHSETLSNVRTDWTYLQPSLYRKGGS